MSKSSCGGASFGGSSSLSKILDLASHKAVVTGEWYIPGHKLMGFLFVKEELLASPLTAEGSSKGEANVDTTGIVVGDEGLNSIFFGEGLGRIELIEDERRKVFVGGVSEFEK